MTTKTKTKKATSANTKGIFSKSTKLKKHPDLLIMIHTTSEDNGENPVFSGLRDVSLSSVGVIEAHKAGKKFQTYGIQMDRIYTSSLKRSIQTAEILKDYVAKAKTKTEIISEFHERDWGNLHGILKKPYKEKHLDFYQDYNKQYYERLPGSDAETIYEIEQRINKALINLCKKVKKSKYKTLLIIHSNVLRATLKTLLSLSPEEALKLKTRGLIYAFSLSGKNPKLIGQISL